MICSISVNHLFRNKLRLPYIAGAFTKKRNFGGRGSKENLIIDVRGDIRAGIGRLLQLQNRPLRFVSGLLWFRAKHLRSLSYGVLINVIRRMSLNRHCRDENRYCFVREVTGHPDRNREYVQVQ